LCVDAQSDGQVGVDEFFESPENMNQESEPQAHAKAEYADAMAKMKTLSDKLGHMSEDYEARAQVQDKLAKKAGEKEREEVATAMAAAPLLGLQTSQQVVASQELANNGNGKEDALDRALRHPEVNKMLSKLEAEHKIVQRHMETDPMAALKHLQEQQEEKKKQDTASQEAWMALRDGWHGEPENDEANVQYKAWVIEHNLKKQGTVLSQEQKHRILEAVRTHEKNGLRINMAKRRLAAMNKLIEADSRQAKKERMQAEAEQLYDENDGMLAEVAAAKGEAKQALLDQKIANEIAEEELVQEFKE